MQDSKRRVILSQICTNGPTYVDESIGIVYGEVSKNDGQRSRSSSFVSMSCCM